MNRFWVSILCVLWLGSGLAQSFPYQLSVTTVPGHCYDDARLVFTLWDGNGNEVLIDPQTHNAVNTDQYPLYNVQFHYQNVSSGLGVQYDYNNDIQLSAGTYCVGVSASVPAQGGYALVDTTFCNVQLTSEYNHLEAAAIFELASGTWEGNQERYGYRPSFHCADIGRIQLQITQGSFPYEVTILDDQQDTFRHEFFYQRVNNGNSYFFANYRDYYNFDGIPIGTYSIIVSDSCGYVAPMITFTIPDAEPYNYMMLVHTNYRDYSNDSHCPDTNVVQFEIQRDVGAEYGSSWMNYMFDYFDSTFRYRFINPGNDTTAWRTLPHPSPYSSSGSWTMVFDTLPNYCVIFNDTITVQLHDLCHDSLMSFSSRYIPQFGFFDSMQMAHTYDTLIHDTCAAHLVSGMSTQSYMKGGGTWDMSNVIVGAGWYDYVAPVPFRYYRCPLSYDVWSLPDSTLLGHAESDEFTGLGSWVTFSADTAVPVHISVTDALGCQVAGKDTVWVYHPQPVDDLYFWFECHNDIDDDGNYHCCEDRYLWIQEHGVEANTFRRNMTLHLIESPLYNQYNFTAIRQDGVWSVTPDNPNNHSTYVEFSYEDGWRATIRDSICLPPGRYTFLVSTDCGDTTITYEWAGFYYDTLAFTSPPQYEFHQVCDHIVVTQVSTGLENDIYFIDPSVSNDVPFLEDYFYSHFCYSPAGISSTRDDLGRDVLVFSVPGTYPLTTYAINGWCSPYAYFYDTITIEFSYLDFDNATALLCNSSSETGIVMAQAINGNVPYLYTLYDQWGATGNVVATSTTGFFENVPMTEGQHFSVQVVDSCSTSFFVNITAALMTNGTLVWEQNPQTGIPYCEGDTVQLTALTFPAPATYQWTGPNGFSSTSQTNEVVLPDYGASYWYKVEILNSFCGPLIADSIEVFVAPPPQVTILGDSMVCPGAEVALSFVPQGSGQVTFDLFQINGQQTLTVAANSTLTQNYSVPSDGLFWVDNIFDDYCPSHASAESFHVGTYVLNPEPTHLYDTILENALPYLFAGQQFDNEGVFPVVLEDQHGCDSLLSLHLTVLHNVTTSIDSAVCESELPITWNGVEFTAAGTQSAVLTDHNGIDSTVVMHLQTRPLPVAAISGPFALCSDTAVVLTADSATTYLWSTGATTRDIIVTETGSYSVTVSDPYGCVATASHPIMEPNNPILSVNAPEMCAGGSYTFSVGYQSHNNIHLGQGETTLSLTDTIFLPDGIYCEPFGCSYRSPLTFTAYADGDTIQTADDIYYVRLNMEHSWIGDLYINITCPNGQKADLLKYGGTGTSQCNSQITQSSRGWAFGNNIAYGNYLGDAYDYDVASCDASMFGNEQGIGWNYCWSNNTTQGYQYAAGDGLIYRYGNAHNGIVDSSNVAAGTQFYHPDDSFSSLIGCPLNGDWYIEVQDGWNADNGYIFGWELSLSNEMLPDISFEFDYSTADGPWVTNLSDSLFLITPPSDLAHDTTIAYTFTVYDTAGCSFDTTFFITFFAAAHSEFDTVVCGTFVWNDTVYSQSGQYEQHFQSAAGCDSVVTCHLVVNPLAATYDTLTLMENQLPYHYAPTNTIYTMQSPLVSQSTYTLTSSQGCDSVVQLMVYIYHNVSYQVDTTVCAANLPYTWHGHSFAAAGIHVVTMQTSHGADSIVTYHLMVDNLSVNIGNVTHITCYGNSTGAATVSVANGQSPMTYAWKNAAGTTLSSTTTLSNVPAGVYTFTVSDNLGCTVTTSVTLNTLNGALQAGSISASQELCVGEAIAPFTGTAATGGDNGAYQWQISTDGTDWTTAPGTATTQNYTYPGTADATFSLRRVWATQSCGTVYSNIVTVTVWPISNDTLTAEVCQGETYQENGFDITADQTLETGFYTYEQHYSSGPCDSSVVLLMTVHPDYETALEDEICEGGGYNSNGFSISPFETVGVQELNRTLNLQSEFGCDSVLTLHLTVIDTDLRIVPLSDNFCEEQSMELMAVTQMTDYMWNTGEDAPNITVLAPGYYTVTATQGACSNTARYLVQSCHLELYLPNAITPSNGDGLNDWFSIPEANTADMALFEISIFNRWGEMVFYSSDKHFKWNGEYRGSIQYQAIYTYVIKYTDNAGRPHRVTGNITVL